MLLLPAAPGFACGATPPSLIPNTGQLDPAVRYFVQTPDLRAAFSYGAATFQMQGQTLQVRFDSANAQSGCASSRAGSRRGLTSSPGTATRKTGEPVNRSMEKSATADLYPGIDMTYAEAGHLGLSLEFLVAPGADPEV